MQRVRVLGALALVDDGEVICTDVHIYMKDMYVCMCVREVYIKESGGLGAFT